MVFADGHAEVQDLPEATASSKFLLILRSRFSRRATPCVRIGWMPDGTPRFAEDNSLVSHAGWGFGTDAYAGGLLL